MIKFLKKIRIKIRNSFGIRKKLILLMSGLNLPFVYYKFISRQFNAEQKRVLIGIGQYYRDIDASFLLRRNIHRLEKGLIMQPRRNLFAESYILETVIAFDAYIKSNNIDNNLLEWSFNILKSYFQVVGVSHVISKSKEIFKNASDNKRNIQEENLPIPFKRSDSQHIAITYNDLLDLSLRRRSIRWYQNRGVERKLIDSALRVSLLSPSACNRQPFRYQIFDEPNIVNAVINIPGGTAGWSHSPPVVVALLGQLNAFCEERDKHVVYIDGSLSAMAFMLALETLGLGSCAINFPDIPEYHEEIKRVANLKDFETTIMLIALGYPDEDSLVPFSAKKELNNIRSYNNEK